MAKKTTKSKTFRQAVALVLRLEEKGGLSPGQIAKRIESLGYPNSRGAKGWHPYTVRRIIDKNRPEPRRESGANSRKSTGSKSLKKAGAKAARGALATMPTTPAKQEEKAAALAVLDYFDGKGTGEASEQAGKRFADAMATAEPTEQRRGLKRITRAGWESLPEPVREAVIERIYKEVVGL